MWLTARSRAGSAPLIPSLLFWRCQPHLTSPRSFTPHIMNNSLPDYCYDLSPSATNAQKRHCTPRLLTRQTRQESLTLGYLVLSHTHTPCAVRRKP